MAAHGRQLLPDELLWMIIEHVDDRFTLNALLITCRSTFHAAVKQLWSDPFGYKFDTAEGCLPLFNYVLALSPSQHPALARLGQPPFTEPFIDYLSLIRHARLQYHDVFFDELDEDDSLTNIVRALPWMICDSDFSQLDTIAIMPADATTYIEVIPTMTQLKKVVWMQGHSISLYEILRIRQFVVAFLAVHGEHGRQLEMQFDPFDADQPLKVFSDLAAEIVDISCMLGPFPPSKRVISSAFDWLRCVAHAQTMDFRHIRKISIEATDEVFTILPRCLTLEELEFSNLIHAHMLFSPFARPTGCDSLGKQPAPIAAPAVQTPPLRSVRLFIPLSELPIFMNGFVSNFGGTLEEIRFDMDCNNLNRFNIDTSGQDDNRHFSALLGGTILAHFQTMQWIFPNLRRLTLKQIGYSPIHTVVYGDMSGMPKLEELTISGIAPKGTLTAIPYHTVPPWRLPELRRLTLDTAVAAYFVPESLCNSPKLQYLELCSDLVFAKLKPVTSLRLNWKKVVALRESFCLDSLKTVVLRDYSGLIFDFETLGELMPAVESLKIEIDDRLWKGTSSTLIRDMFFKSVENRARHGPDGEVFAPAVSLCHLQELVLGVRLTQRAMDCCNLLHQDLAPRLQVLKIRCLAFDHLGWLVMAACKHPTVRCIVVDTFDTIKPSAEFKCALAVLGMESLELDFDDCDPRYIRFDLPNGIGRMLRCVQKQPFS